MRRLDVIGARLIACILLLAGCLPARGAEPFYDSGRPAKLLDINPHIGVGMSSIIQNYGSAVPGLSDFLLSPGCLIGAGVDVRFAIRNSFGIGTGLEFGINNLRYSMSIIDGGTGSISSMYVRSHFYTASVPLYLTTRFNIGRTIKWNVDFGVYLAKGLGGKTKIIGYASGMNSLDQPIVTHASYTVDYFNADDTLINGVKDFDWGPRIATGLTYKHRYTLNAVLQVSAPNLASNKGVLDIKYRNINLEFQVGYIF